MYGDDKLTVELVDEALDKGRGRWGAVLAELSPELFRSIGCEHPGVLCSVRGGVHLLRILPQADCLEVWFDLSHTTIDGLEALNLLGGYSPGMAADMILTYDERHPRSSLTHSWCPTDEKDIEVMIFQLLSRGQWRSIFADLAPEVPHFLDTAPAKTPPNDPTYGAVAEEDFPLAAHVAILGKVKGWTICETIRQIAGWICRQPDGVFGPRALAWSRLVLESYGSGSDGPPFEGPWPIDEAWPVEEPPICEGTWPFADTDEAHDRLGSQGWEEQ